MTPKEKAKELITKFSANTVHYDATKQCALLTVNELIDHCNYINKWYWEEVKQQIELL